jgi:hypothetical protein
VTAEVQVRDHVLWIAHIRGGPGLQVTLSALPSGDEVELQVDGVVGVWCKMAKGAPGLRPLSKPALDHWHDLQIDRGRFVPIAPMNSLPDAGADEGQTGRTEVAALIVKCPPAQIEGDGRCLIFSKPYEGVEPTPGQTVYLWFSETDGGQGLAHRGRLLAAGDGTPIPLAIQVDAVAPGRAFGTRDLAPYRDATEPVGLVGLARKLFKNSHNKIAVLSDEEAAVLAQWFEPALISPALDAITEAELTALEHVKGDGRRMFADTTTYRLTTSAENPDAEAQRRPGTLRGIAADFILRSGGSVSGRALHHYMLNNAGPLKWDYGYVHRKSSDGLPMRGATRDWIRAVTAPP